MKSDTRTTCGCAKQPEGFHFLSAPTPLEPLGYSEGLKPSKGLNCVQALGVALHRSEVAQVCTPSG